MKPSLVCLLAFLLGVIIIGCVGCAGRSRRIKLQSPIDPSLQFDLRPPIIDNGTKNP